MEYDQIVEMTAVMMPGKAHPFTWGGFAESIGAFLVILIVCLVVQWCFSLFLTEERTSWTDKTKGDH